MHLVNLAQCGYNYRFYSRIITAALSLDVRVCNPACSSWCVSLLWSFLIWLWRLGWLWFKAISSLCICVCVCVFESFCYLCCWNVPCTMRRYLCYSSSICLCPLFICCFNDLIDCPLGSEGWARCHHITTGQPPKIWPVVFHSQLTGCIFALLHCKILKLPFFY